MTVVDQIRRHRTAEAVVTVVDATGSPLAGGEVVVAQRRHRFRFGGTDFELVDLANGELEGERLGVVERSAEAFLDLFDFATLPFYWGRFEPVRGRPDTARIRTAAQLARRPRRAPSRATRCAGTRSRPTGCWTCPSTRSSTSSSPGSGATSPTSPA